MNNYPKLRTALSVALLLFFVAGASMLSVRLWGGKPEQPEKHAEITVTKGMTLEQFGQANALSNSALKEIFNLKQKSDLEKKVAQYGTPEQITALVVKKRAILAEHAVKNWEKIFVKFGLWFVFLAAVFFFLKNRKVTASLRKWLLVAAVAIFGVILGSDPSPMGTVKDAIHLYATTGAIFPPRMIALTIFLLLVFFANKYLCSWGCQAGTLQDLVFRINQTDDQKAVIGRQIKLPFALTNTIRFAVFCVLTIVAFAWGFDIIDPIDPFKIYKPAQLGLIGGGFVGTILLAGLFLYRPWCHLFCPFGFVGWLVEKVSLVKINVNYETCIACQTCAASCPSTVMGAILRRDKKTIPDCFACYVCRDVCPTNSIRFSTTKRTLPPAGHFK